jgi:hypothetical protein
MSDPMGDLKKVWYGAVEWRKEGRFEKVRAAPEDS